MYVCVCVCLFVCVSVCVCSGEAESEILTAGLSLEADSNPSHPLIALGADTGYTAAQRCVCVCV